MSKPSLKLMAAAGVLAFAGHAAADYPLMNMVADKVIQKYQSATCEQLWAQEARLAAAKSNKNGQTYYLSGNTWFLPAYGANGVHYTVVAAP